MLWFDAKSDTFLSNVAAPTSIISFSISLVLENLELNLIVIPLSPASLIKVLEPAPKMLIFLLLSLILLKNSKSWFLLSGLKKISAGPPRLNQLYLDKLSLIIRFLPNFFF